MNVSLQIFLEFWMNHGVDREGSQSFAPLGQVGYTLFPAVCRGLVIFSSQSYEN